VVNLDASIAHAHDVHVGSAEVIVPGLLEQ
jgi:hypothetical protein